MIAPALRKALPMNDFPQDVVDFFAGVFTDMMHERARTGVVRNDVMQSLIQARTDLVVNKTEPSGKRNRIRIRFRSWLRENFRFRSKA